MNSDKLHAIWPKRTGQPVEMFQTADGCRTRRRPGAACKAGL